MFVVCCKQTSMRQQPTAPTPCVLALGSWSWATCELACNVTPPPSAPHMRVQELTVWGNDFGPGGARALSEALSSPALQGLRCDARPYTVDGQVQVALQDV